MRVFLSFKELGSILMYYFVSKYVKNTFALAGVAQC